MLNSIIDGICVALNAEFGDEYEIYTESVKQGLNPPCFIVTCINPTQELFMGVRYVKNNSFCIHFFPGSDDEAKAEINCVRDRLFNALEYITVDGDLVRGSDMTAEADDEQNVLNFMIAYNFFVRKQREEADVMENIEINLDGKHEENNISGGMGAAVGVVSVDMFEGQEG